MKLFVDQCESCTAKARVRSNYVYYCTKCKKCFEPKNSPEILKKGRTLLKSLVVISFVYIGILGATISLVESQEIQEIITLLLSVILFILSVIFLRTVNQLLKNEPSPPEILSKEVFKAKVQSIRRKLFRSLGVCILFGCALGLLSIRTNSFDLLLITIIFGLTLFCVAIINLQRVRKCLKLVDDCK